VAVVVVAEGARFAEHVGDRGEVAGGVVAVADAAAGDVIDAG
jgi:hypothetical protein